MSDTDTTYTSFRDYPDCPYHMGRFADALEEYDSLPKKFTAYVRARSKYNAMDPMAREGLRPDELIIPAKELVSADAAQILALHDIKIIYEPLANAEGNWRQDFTISVKRSRLPDETNERKRLEKALAELFQKAPGAKLEFEGVGIEPIVLNLDDFSALSIFPKNIRSFALGYTTLYIDQMTDLLRSNRLKKLKNLTIADSCPLEEDQLVRLCKSTQLGNLESLSIDSDHATINCETWKEVTHLGSLVGLRRLEVRDINNRFPDDLLELGRAVLGFHVDGEIDNKFKLHNLRSVRLPKLDEKGVETLKNDLLKHPEHLPNLQSISFMRSEKMHVIDVAELRDIAQKKALHATTKQDGTWASNVRDGNKGDKNGTRGIGSTAPAKPVRRTKPPEEE